MKITIVLLSLLFCYFSCTAQVCETVGSGQWNSAATWSCDVGTTPEGATGRVLIREGHTVSISNYDANFNGEMAVWGQLLFTDVGFGPFSRLFMDATSFVDIHVTGSVAVDNAATCFCRIAIGTNTFVFSPLFGGGTNPEVGIQTISQAGYTPGTLPIVLSKFESNLKERSITLKWETISEINFSHFEIEKSVEGEEFFSIGKINGHGESTTLKSYAFEDYSPVLGNNYYRLKQVDLDGTFEYSNLLLENYDLGLERSMTIYPNPIQNDIVNLNLNFVPTDNSRIKVFDSFGRLIHEELISDIRTTLNLNNKLSPQFYVVMLESDNNTYVGKFVSQ